MAPDDSHLAIHRLLVRFFVSFLLLLSLPVLSYGAESGKHEPVTPNKDQGFYPFEKGEHTLYWASWNGIPVASAEIRAGPLVIKGEQFYKVKIKLKTWKYLDFIWKMRDSIESIFRTETIRPHRFIFRQRENRRKINTIARYDVSRDKWVVQRKKGSKIRRFEFISSDTLDPVSAVYLARTLNLKVAGTIKMKVFGGKSRYLVTLKVMGRERIKTKRGIFDTYKVVVPRIVNLSKSGYARRMRKTTVWVSADKKRLLLRMISKVFIGSVRVEMTRTKG
ncbi:MAG: DUF3108 domain-containing protein [Candidatus Binatia bacterium]